MSHRLVWTRSTSRRAQRGQAALLTAVLIVLGIGGLLLATTNTMSVTISNRHDQYDEKVLAQVKDALIGWSASRTPTIPVPNARPGELPCPDIDNSGTDPGACTAGAIGRVPWKSMGIPEPKDSAGETLWYAIAGPFRNYSMSSAAIQSDTLGNLTVYHGSSATTLTSVAIAVIFAPRASIGTQNRSAATTAFCATTGTTILRNLCATNYLEATGGGNNGQTGGPFIRAQDSSTFNDRLLVVTAADLMPIVEQRVARELRTILQAYKANTACACTNLGGTPGCYPWADLSDGYSDAPPYDPGTGNNRGRIPTFGAAPHDWGTNPCGTALPTLPVWWVNNDWRQVIYYSAGKNFLGPDPCTTCVDTTLTLNGVPGKEVVILTPGPLLGSPPRAPVPTNDFTYWSYYFDDAENQDNGNDLFVTPSSTAYARDRIFTIP